MMKHRYVLTLIMVLLSGCFARDKPVANLKFSSFHQSDGGYAIAFYSDRDIDALFSPDMGEKTVARSLICALEEDRDFRVEHNLGQLFDGTLVFEKKEDAGRYRYLSEGNFFLSWDGDARRRTFGRGEVLKLIENKREIDCKVAITVYLHRPYYSDTMKIPVVALTDVLKKVAPPPSCCNLQDAFSKK